MITMKFQGLRFDDARILKHVDTATRKVLSKFGAFVMQTAKRSIRRRKSASEPGKPPTNQTGLLKKFIWFSYEPASRNVVIGPAPFWSGGARVLEPLEYGGDATVWEAQWKHSGKWDVYPRNWKLGENRKARRSRKIKMAARPFMNPAFEKEKQQLPRLWADSITN